MSASELLQHEPCPSCGSRDNLARYSDGHGYCFGCKYHEKGEGDAQPTRRRRVPSGLIEGEFTDLKHRGLREETLRKFDYRIGEHGGARAHAATYYDGDGTPVAQKLRLKGKQFTWVGEPKRAALFGQQLWKAGGRKVCVTEGEIDAMSLSQVQANRWPVVSVPNGASGAARACAEQLEWLEAFDEIVFMFDMDGPGRAAARECADLLTPGKARIAELPRKDPNELLVAGEVKELISCMWSAKVYRPDGIVSGADLWDQVSEDRPVNQAHYPWAGLEEMLRGQRLGEIVTWCAGTGIGKSTVCREIAYDLLQRGETVGYVALEENVRGTLLALMSIHCDHRLHLGRDGIDEPTLKAAFDATGGTERLFLYDHFGSMESHNLFLKMKQLVRGFGVKWLVLDHVSIVVSGSEVDNERKELDIVMTRLRTLAEELNVGIHVVSHLRRREGKSHEQGGRVSLSDLRGSQAIAQLSDIVVGLERDQQSGDADANTATVRVLKNRFSGETGVAGQLTYDRETGRLRDAEGFDTDAGAPGSEF